MTTPRLAEVPVRSADDLTGRWRVLLEPPTFAKRSLWLTWFDAEGRQSPVVVPVDDLPEWPDPGMFAGLRALNETVVSAQLGDGGQLAMALCRPGTPAVSDSDDAWVAALSEVFDELADQTWSLHLAAAGEIEPLVQPDTPEPKGASR
jgi:hypothetical protein